GPPATRKTRRFSRSAVSRVRPCASGPHAYADARLYARVRYPLARSVWRVIDAFATVAQAFACLSRRPPRYNATGTDTAASLSSPRFFGAASVRFSDPQVAGSVAV